MVSTYRPKETCYVTRPIVGLSGGGGGGREKRAGAMTKDLKLQRMATQCSLFGHLVLV